MNAWEEKQAAKAERFRERAEKARAESAASAASAHRMADIIPFGQPILVGHHSEGRHRRDIERIHRGYERASEAQEKAEYYDRRAENAENGHVISSDDPDAVPKLRAKLAEMEAQRERIKAENREARAAGR